MDEKVNNSIIANAHKSARFRDYYDHRWEMLADGRWPGSYGYGQIRVAFINWAIKQLINKTPLTILDLGCGTGWLSKALAEHGNVTGIDFAPDTLARARQLYGDFAEFVVADPNSLTLGLEREFDLVVASEVIEHVEDQGALLKQITNLLKPNGWLILTTPNQKLKQHFMRDPRKTKYIQPIENWLTPEELKSLLLQTGFIVKQHEGFTTARNFGYTPLQRVAGQWLVRRIASRLGAQRLYTQLILPLAMYQMVVAQCAQNSQPDAQN